MKTIGTEDLKKIQLEIARHIDLFCKKHGIRYFICGGTLIGAIRHKGFIPWDDDIDIMMMRDDYERFICEYASEDKSKYNIFHHSLNDKYPYPYAKISDSETIFHEEIKESFELGVNIDVFPIDIVPEDTEIQNKMYRTAGKYMRIITLKRLPMAKRRGIVKNAVLFVSHLLLSFISFKTIVHKLGQNASKYRHTASSLCGVAVWGYGIREINDMSNYDKSIYMPFENIELPVPFGYDKYLHGIYGDYMQLPSKDKRMTHHHFQAYWK